jgi:hypothetical protein
VLAQRDVEGDGKPYHHVPARRCAAEFQKTQMPLRDARRARAATGPFSAATSGGWLKNRVDAT